MPVCPACGEQLADTDPACPRCHLATGHFDLFREVAGDGAADPKVGEALRELLQAAGVTDAQATETGEGGSASAAAPSPALSAPAGSVVRERVAEPYRGPLVLPALPPVSGVPALRKQVDDLLQLGQRQGLELADLRQRTREALVTEDRTSLESISRDLFVHVAASLAEEIGRVEARRDELAGLVAAPTVNVELEAIRSALATGDLEGTQVRLRRVDEALGRLEDEWATVQILTTECDLIAGAVRELHGDPAPAAGPLEEGRRLVRAGRRTEAEPILARAVQGHWAIATPLVLADLKRLATEVANTPSTAPARTALAATLREFAAALKRRNYGAAVVAYQRLRDSTTGPPAGATAN
ncbi:MAG TPA: hypothetical protein VFF67_07005 [Thermoplasmata archaeon]|nr:hypothetical protein [Thermoplasmata archaeon]